MDNREIGGLLSWAENAETSTPDHMTQGIAYRRDGMSAGEFQRGQQYLGEGKSEEYNYVLWLLSSLVKECEKYGVMRWSDKTDYETCALCIGYGGKLYQALEPSGPSTGGAQVTENSSYWQLWSFFDSHNDLPARDANDAHPINSITGLDDAINTLTQDLDNEIARAEAAVGELQAAIDSVDQNLTAETARAEAAVENLQTVLDSVDAAKPNRTELASILTDARWTADGTAVTATYTTYDAETKTSKTFTRTLPVATDANHGVMTKEAYSALQQAVEDIQTLQQHGGGGEGGSALPSMDGMYMRGKVLSIGEDPETSDPVAEWRRVIEPPDPEGTYGRANALLTTSYEYAQEWKRVSEAGALIEYNPNDPTTSDQVLVKSASDAAPLIQPTHVQREVRVALPGESVELLGYIDVQEGMTAIRDTKTSAKTPPANAADKSDQLTIYAMMSHVIDGAIPDRLVLDYLVDTKMPEYKPFVSTRTVDDFNPLLRRIEAVLMALEKGVFIPAQETDWGCSPRWCGYWETCQYTKKQRPTN